LGKQKFGKDGDRRKDPKRLKKNKNKERNGDIEYEFIPEEIRGYRTY
jgi:hypothetical protein